MENRYESLGRIATHKIQIDSRDQFGYQICASVPSEYVAFEL
jgi:hypothetical protein